MKSLLFIINALMSWIGTYVLIGGLWKYAEVKQFGEDIYMFSVADSVVCFFVSGAIAVLLKLWEDA